MREAQQPTVLPPNYNPSMSDSLVAGAINAQRNRMNEKKNPRIDISPATYVPSPIATSTVDYDLQNAMQQRLAKSYRVEKFVNKELIASKEPEKI